MVVVAQLVRALDCGSRGRRFETGLPPNKWGFLMSPLCNSVLKSEEFFKNIGFYNDYTWHVYFHNTKS